MSDTSFDPIAYINTPRWTQSRMGLSRIRELLDRLGRPQDALKFVHVAGTNGKGSTCAFVERMLRVAGYRTGLFTSPYIMQFEERIRVCGQNISMDDLRDITLLVREQAEAMEDHPTEFELMTAVAFMYFAREHCDICVVEVGMGGELDSTNVIEVPEVCVICRIGLDHTAILGNTIAEIAQAKAGIIKSGVPVVSWPQEASAQDVVADTCMRKSCALSTPDLDRLDIAHTPTPSDPRYRFSYKDLEDLFIGLLGAYQPANAAMAIEVVGALRSRGWDISDKCIREGLATCSWPGRFEVVAHDPVFVVDGGHNPQGARALADSLDTVFPGVRPVLIMGVLADKDYRSMLREVLPKASALFAVTPNNPRALLARDLARESISMLGEIGDAGLGTQVVACDGFEDAVTRARDAAQRSGTIVCAFGSLYSIADIMRALRKVS